MKKVKNNYLMIILFILLLLTIIFINKEVYLAPNMNVNLGLFIYPFTFLLLILIYNKFNIKIAKETIYINFLMILLFYFLVSILNTLDSITSSQVISDNLRNVFTPKYFAINNLIFYYPNLVFLLSYSVTYFICHYIFITIYEAIESSSNYIIGFILALLISFTLNQMIFTPIVNIPNLIDGTMVYKDLIILMTGNFIVVIFSSILLLFIYALIYKKTKN